MALPTLFTSAWSFFKLKSASEHVDIDDFSSKIIYRYTVGFILACCVLVSATAYLGSPIHCFEIDKLDLETVNNYCWIATTFSLPKHHNKQIGKDVAYHGIGPHKPGDEVVYHSYYQWIPFFLFFEAVLLYIPHMMWKSYEGKTTKMLTQGLRDFSSAGKDRRKKERRIAFILTHTKHNKWLFVNFLCSKILYCIILMSLIFLTDKFLGGTFSTYGFEVLKFTLYYHSSTRTDPMSRVFPIMTKCTFYNYGPSGGLQTLDTLCVLPLNNINEKIFTFLWFWKMGMCFVVVAGLVPPLLWALSRYRVKAMKKSTYNHFTKRMIKKLSTSLPFPNFFVLYLVGKNVPDRMFQNIVKHMCDDVGLADTLDVEKSVTLSGNNNTGHTENQSDSDSERYEDPHQCQ